MLNDDETHANTRNETQNYHKDIQRQTNVKRCKPTNKKQKRLKTPTETQDYCKGSQNNSRGIQKYHQEIQNYY